MDTGRTDRRVTREGLFRFGMFPAIIAVGIGGAAIIWFFQTHGTQSFWNWLDWGSHPEMGMSPSAWNIFVLPFMALAALIFGSIIVSAGIGVFVSVRWIIDRFRRSRIGSHL